MRDYRKEWEIADKQIKGTQRFLTVFVSLHLVVIGGSLFLIPYIPRLKNRFWIAEELIFVAILVLMVGSVGWMVFTALKTNAKKGEKNHGNRV